MNYSANDIPRTLAMSQKNAIAIQGDCEGLYQGVWIASMDRQWTNFHADGAEQVGLCLWGEHKISRFFQFAIGDNTMELQSNYQKLLEKGFLVVNVLQLTVLHCLTVEIFLKYPTMMINQIKWLILLVLLILYLSVLLFKEICLSLHIFFG